MYGSPRIPPAGMHGGMSGMFPAAGMGPPGGISPMSSMGNRGSGMGMLGMDHAGFGSPGATELAGSSWNGNWDAIHEADALLAQTAQIVEEALAQDEQQLALDRVCAPGVGSADYERQQPQFNSQRIAALPPPLRRETEAAATTFRRQGVLPDIRYMWRSFDSHLVLWKLSDQGAPDVTEYQGVTQQIVACATARPKDFVTGVPQFLVISTPVEVSLHALRFAPGTDRLLPITRTQFSVATDDVVVGSIACCSETGRIFLGGSDGCIHELAYFDNETNWLGTPRKTTKYSVSRTMQSRLPTFLRKMSEAICGTDGIKQLVFDSSRGLLYALSDKSAITVFELPPARRDANGKLEEPSIVQRCQIAGSSATFASALSSQIYNTRQTLFPGLGPERRGMFGNMQQAPHINVVKLLPVAQTQGGMILLCAIMEDGTRIYFQGNYRKRQSMFGGMQQTPMSAMPGTTTAANPDDRIQWELSEIRVYHVRFIDTSLPSVRVRDAVNVGEIMLFLGEITHANPSSCSSGLYSFGGAQDQSAGSSASQDGDVIIAVSSDLRIVAQRQSRGRSPWLSAPLGLSEHAEIIPLKGSGREACQVMALATFDGRLPQHLRFLYHGDYSKGMVSSVVGLSELARQQLLPAPRFLVVSTSGVHLVTKIQPVDAFRQQVFKGDMPRLRDFALQFTAEQTCALCFQLLTGAVTRLAEVDPDLVALGHAAPSQLDSQRLRNAAPQNSWGGAPASLGAIGAPGNMWNDSVLPGSRMMTGLDQQRPAEARAGLLDPGWRDPDEELTLTRVEQLLLNPQKAAEMGFVQAWPAVDTRAPQQMNTPLGHSSHTHGAHRISGRLRGLSLYLSRILRPLWLSPVMVVNWPARIDNRPKRPLGGLAMSMPWPAPPEPPPVVQGAQWRCTWSKQQRSYVYGQLVKLTAIFERCKSSLAPHVIGARARVGVPTAATNMMPDGPEAEAIIANGISLLLTTAVEALSFLDLVATRTDVLTAAQVPPQALIRFAELTFRDLICQPDARRVLQQLMQGGVVGGRQLHAKCPRLFSAVDLEVQEACELLAVVQNSLGPARGAGSTLDMAHLSILVQRALRTLERYPAKVELADIASRLRSIGAWKGMISLCVRIARVRDPHDQCLRVQDPSNARVQQLHYARLECYQLALQLFEELLEGKQRHEASSGAVTAGTSAFQMGCGGYLTATGKVDTHHAATNAREVPELLPVPVHDSQAYPVLDLLLNHCLEGQPYLSDEMFHFCILKWMINCKLPAFRYDSPYLKGFLEKHARDQPEFLCQYYQHRGRWAEASDAYMAVARDPGARKATPTRSEGEPLSRDDRLVLLQSAALCAKMPGSNRREELILREMDKLRSCSAA